MAYPLKKQEKKFTYNDYLTWPDEERWELIEGVAYDMSPAPSRQHQAILRELLLEFASFLRGKNCRVYVAPFDVRLPERGEKDEDITNVVQPDLVVVCDRQKLDNRGCKGAPTIVIEIVSPYTVSKDIQKKFFLYERFGVKEYWIVHPIDKTVMVFKLEENGEYGRPKMYTENDKVEVDILGALVIDLDIVFREE
ncbi:MAG: Uma2 family endonuclease [bacterium]